MYLEYRKYWFMEKISGHSSFRSELLKTQNQDQGSTTTVKFKAVKNLRKKLSEII